ncbi:MAG: GTP 3',8-cyclase MoaA [Thermoleophilia bacterium]|nr:GTP 3',8-cyclase MoaA [Thermoleophilia bacterium]
MIRRAPGSSSGNRVIAGSGAGRRTIDYLRISITDRCNFRCRYCMPQEGIHPVSHDDILSFEEIVRVATAAVDAGVSRVRITGGEPLVRRGCVDLIEQLAMIPGVSDLSLTTNGSLLESQAVELRAAGLSRINISIDSLDGERFSRITGGGDLALVMAGLDSALDAGFAPVKVNAVALEGIEDDLAGFVAMTRERPVHVRFIEFMPIGWRLGEADPGGRRPSDVRSGDRQLSSGPWKFVPRARLLAGLAAFGELRPVASPGGGGPARYFKFRGAEGTIGFISSMSDHFCSRCNRLRLTADGRLRNCLFSDEETDIRPHIGGDRTELTRIIFDSMNSKKFSRTGVRPGARTMSQIGG